MANLGKLWEMVRDREAWHASVYGVTKSEMTWQLNNNKDEYRHTSFYCTLKMLHFLTNWRFVATLHWARCYFFPIEFAYFMSLCHILVILAIFQIFHNFIFVMMICDQWSLRLLLQNIITHWRVRWWLAFFSKKIFFNWGIRLLHT